MKKIKKMVEQIKDELEGAEEYAECALKYKADDSELASMYHQMAQEELRHMTKLHDKITEEIAKYRKEKGEAPAAMQAVWDYEHEKMIDEAKEIKILIEMYRE